MNKVMLIGNLCKDPQQSLQRMKNGKLLMKNTIAVKRNFKNQDNVYETDFINFTCYEPTCNFIAQYCQKGNKVSIVGRWQTGSFTDKDGNTRYTNDCIVEQLELLTYNQNNQQQNQNYQQQQNQPTNNGQSNYNYNYNQQQQNYNQYQDLDIPTDDLPF